MKGFERINPGNSSGTDKQTGNTYFEAGDHKRSKRTSQDGQDKKQVRFSDIVPSESSGLLTESSHGTNRRWRDGGPSRSVYQPSMKTIQERHETAHEQRGDIYKQHEDNLRKREEEALDAYKQHIDNIRDLSLEIKGFGWPHDKDHLLSAIENGDISLGKDINGKEWSKRVKLMESAKETVNTRIEKEGNLRTAADISIPSQQNYHSGGSREVPPPKKTSSFAKSITDGARRMISKISTTEGYMNIPIKERDRSEIIPSEEIPMKNLSETSTRGGRVGGSWERMPVGVPEIAYPQPTQPKTLRKSDVTEVQEINATGSTTKPVEWWKNHEIPKTPPPVDASGGIGEPRWWEDVPL